jgi:hypothetical protein
MILEGIFGAGLASVAVIVSLFSDTNTVVKSNVSYETDRHWMRKSIEALPPCAFNAYGSVRRILFTCGVRDS